MCSATSAGKYHLGIWFFYWISVLERIIFMVIPNSGVSFSGDLLGSMAFKNHS